MSKQSEHAATVLVVPYFDFVVISSGYKEGLLVVKADAPDWPIVLIILLEECAHSIVPELNDTIVKTHQYPGSLGVEGKALDPCRLSFKFG